MPRLDIEIDEETRQGLVWAAAYFHVSLDQMANMLLLATLAEFTNKIISDKGKRPNRMFDKMNPFPTSSPNPGDPDYEAYWDAYRKDWPGILPDKEEP